MMMVKKGIPDKMSLRVSASSNAKRKDEKDH